MRVSALRWASASAIGLLLTISVIPALSKGDEECESSKHAVQLCTLVENAAQYDGKEVLVRGLYRMVLHGSILSGSTCSRVEANMRRAQNWKGDKHAQAVFKSITKKDQFQFVDIVIRGTFRIAHQGQCFGQNCLPYEIEETELLCAAPANQN